MKKTFLPIAALLLTISAQGCAELIGESREQMAEKEAVRASLSELRGDTSKLKSDTARLASEADALRASLADAKASLDEARQEIASLRGLIDEKNRTIKKLEENAELISSAVEALDIKINEKTKTLAPLALRVESIEKGPSDSKDTSGLNAYILGMRKDIDDIKAEADAIKKAAEGKISGEERKKEPEKDASQPDAQALYSEAVDMIRNIKDYDKGLELLQRFLDTYPQNELAGNAHYWIGEAYYSKTDWEKAALEFNKVIKSYPGCGKVPAALLKQAYSFDKIDAKKEARITLERLIEKYPASPEAESARKRLKELK